MKTLITPQQSLEYLPHVKGFVRLQSGEIIYALDVGGIAFQSERPSAVGSCYVYAPTIWLIDEEEFEREVTK